MPRDGQVEAVEVQNARDDPHLLSCGTVADIAFESNGRPALLCDLYGTAGESCTGDNVRCGGRRPPEGERSIPPKPGVCGNEISLRDPGWLSPTTF